MDLVFAGGTVHTPPIRSSFSSLPEITLISRDFHEVKVKTDF